MNDNIFWAYVMECEGDLPTRMGQLNGIVKRMRAAANPNDFATQIAAYKAVGLDSDTLTEEEINYIVSKVTEGWR